jgi:hypothetical protein
LQQLVEAGKKIGYDSKKCNSELEMHINKTAIAKDGVIDALKAAKTPVE